MKYRLQVTANAKNTEDLTNLVISDNFVSGEKFIDYLNNKEFPVTVMLNGKSVDLNEMLNSSL